MIDILFNDSACGSFKTAQNYGKKKLIGGVSSVFIRHDDGSRPGKKEIESVKRKVEEQQCLSWKRSIPLDGNPSDIYGFNLMLSVGDILSGSDISKRYYVIQNQYSIYPNGEGEAAKEIISRAGYNIEEVKRRLLCGEDVRVWYSSNPDEMCGLYWFMSCINKWDNVNGKIFTVKLPEWDENTESSIIRKISCGEIAPDEWGRYIKLQREAGPSFIRSCGLRWEELMEENSPLRAVVNGNLLSVNEDFYDCFIQNELAAAGDELNEAVLIGRIIGKYQLGIGDAWIAHRIEKMILKHQLEAVTEPEKDSPIYHRVLRKINYKTDC